VCPLAAQLKTLEADAPGCLDSRFLPKLSGCRIDNCEQKASDRREAPVREDEKTGDPLTYSLDGESRSVMYECAAETTPQSIVKRAAGALVTAGFEVPYQFIGEEGVITARKGDTWLLLEAASNFYTLVELTVAPPDEHVITDATGLAEAIERFGRVTVHGVRFLSGLSDTTMDSEPALRELAVMLTDHPDWRVRIEVHTDNTGLRAANLALSTKRAAAITSWLSGRGVKRIRMEAAGKGDTQPVADNSTPSGRWRNQRLEVVKVD
jgi:outer membrane protein OmpA-like peptidoglycan-associated protein